MPRLSWYACLLATFLSCATPASATAYDLFTLDNPAGTGTQLSGINNAGVIVGNVGTGGARSGFTYAGGIFVPVMLPGYTGLLKATGINDAGNIVGTYSPSDAPPFGETFGYLTDGTNFTRIDLGSGTLSTYPTGINNNGDIAGNVSGFTHFSRGFVLSGGSQQNIPLPPINPETPYPFANAAGINDSGIVVGTYIGFEGQHALLYQGGVSSYFDFPDGRNSQAFGINDAGQIVGSYQNSFGVTFGYIATNGVFQTIAFAGATSTEVTGINESGEIAGNYVDSLNIERGFYGLPETTAVPEPASFIMLATAVGGLLMFSSRAERQRRKHFP